MTSFPEDLIEWGVFPPKRSVADFGETFTGTGAIVRETGPTLPGNMTVAGTVNSAVLTSTVNAPYIYLKRNTGGATYPAFGTLTSSDTVFIRGGNSGGEIIRFMDTGDNNLARFFGLGGFCVGNPVGSDQGYGSVNAQAVYRDGVLIGGYSEASLASGSAMSLTTNTITNVLSLSLGTGDWDVSSHLYFVPAATTNITQIISGVSDTTASFDLTLGRLTTRNYGSSGIVIGSAAETLSVPKTRINLVSPKTIYAVTRVLFTVSTLTVYGIMRARRF